jgi:hypothetical protein
MLKLEQLLREVRDTEHGVTAVAAMTHAQRLVRTDVTPSEQGMCQALFFSEKSDLSLIKSFNTFFGKSDRDKHRFAIVSFMHNYVAHNKSRVHPFATPLMHVACACIRGDQVAANKAEAYALLTTILNLRLPLQDDEKYLPPGEIIKLLRQQLGRSEKSQIVRGAALAAIGLLSELAPAAFQPFAEVGSTAFASANRYLPRLCCQRLTLYSFLHSFAPHLSSRRRSTCRRCTRS